MTNFTGFVDVTGDNSHKVPAVAALGMILLYATGLFGVEATAAEIARFRDAGVGVGLIDQTPSLSVFRAGVAHVAIADIEPEAGTAPNAAAGALSRQKLGEQSVFYVSQDSLTPLKSVLMTSGVDMALVKFGIANYSDSRASAEAALEANPDWVYVQYGDNISNAGTLIPGTNVTCGEASCDIDVALTSWAQQFFLKKPGPAGPFRQVLKPGETAEQFAASRDANTGNLFARSMKLWTAEDLALIENGRMVLYTANP